MRHWKKKKLVASSKELLGLPKAPPTHGVEGTRITGSNGNTASRRRRKNSGSFPKEAVVLTPDAGLPCQGLMPST
jgi:hypothetical protein